MKNIGLGKLKVANVENFTSKTGLKLRRFINKPFKVLLKVATKRKIILERYPNLEKGVPYIFASTHSFDEDIISNLAIIDRNAYVLIGTTDQLDYNPTMYAAWLNGLIYVDRLDKDSRQESLKKMEKVLNNGTSVLLFPEGGWNNTENLIVQKLFAGPYYLAKSTGAQVVPISTFNEMGSDKIYIRVGDPIDLSKYEKKEALKELRDSLASMRYNQIEQHSTPIQRDELGNDSRMDFMEQRKNEYLRVKWTKDVWDEELTIYKDKEIPTEEEVWSVIDNINLTKENAGILAPILVKRLENKKYDFKKYMHENWNK